MKLIGRLLWLLLGLLYRLVVLVLFEKWIPFPDRPVAETAPSAGRAPKKRKKKKPEDPRSAALSERERVAARVRDNRSGKAREPAFFEAKSSELAPELAARLEGEHWLHPDVVRARARAPRPGRETLRGLLRDKRAIRDAVVIGAALGARRKS
jgi:hypothetical protein